MKMRRDPIPVDPQLAASDEAFWRRQEKRRERGMGQPCCTQSGVSWSMIDVPGDFAVPRGNHGVSRRALVRGRF